MSRFPVRTTNDGSITLFHPDFGETFKSQHAAASESREIYLQAGILDNPRFGREAEFCILELGFGIATNFFTVRRWLAESPWAPAIYYVSVDASLQAAEAMAPYMPAAEAYRLKELLQYRRWQEKNLRAELWEDSFAAALATMPSTQKFDAIFFDPFSPRVQPESWSQEIACALAQRLKPDGRLVTYSVAAAARKIFQLAGLGISRQRLSSILHKREALIATQINLEAGE